MLVYLREPIVHDGFRWWQVSCVSKVSSSCLAVHLFVVLDFPGLWGIGSSSSWLLSEVSAESVSSKSFRVASVGVMDSSGQSPDQLITIVLEDSLGQVRHRVPITPP
ncbi:hypothetical protein HAX54_012811 [Datura stramonium]|uniref:Uncharacterized protein n=1 Tax=Datura stramonium TaxID=4076 RepID=A0ABS8TM98_DATST|nr:hypothetical protein [Datura stramonium]